MTSGDAAPDFCLYNADSNRVCLDSLKGDYIYLGFCTSKDYTCIQHYNILQNLYKKHKQHFQIVVISNADNFRQMQRFVQHHDYPWTFLYAKRRGKVMEAYHVKNIPSYFFIDRTGTIRLSPAPAPSENIEERIYRIMKSDGAL